VAENLGTNMTARCVFRTATIVTDIAPDASLGSWPNTAPPRGSRS